MSQKRLVISGAVYELYEYAEPYFYNWPPEARTTNESISQSERLDERREDNLRVAKRAVRRIIEANVSVSGHLPKFVTFTFAENIADLDVGNRLWSAFAKRMCYEFGYALRYLVVVEFQKRGAVHYHALFFNLPYRKNLSDFLAEIWGHGFVNVKAVTKVKALGAYVSKYMTKHGHDKRLLGRKAFFTSRGLERPKEFRNADTIDKILARATILEASDRVYETRQFGTVHYSYKTIKIHG